MAGEQLLTIDGSYGEGGGQILRTSLSLSAALRRPIRIENIRAGRKKPGLQPQHLTAARAVARICDGKLAGGEVGSGWLEFYPGALKSGNYAFNVADVKASAGSVNLIFQTILLPLALSGKQSSVTIKGGTHVPWSPPSDFIDEVYLPALAGMGVLVWHEMHRAGYYPIGGGEIRAEIRSASGIKPIDLTTRPEGTVTCHSFVSNLPMSIAERELNEALAGMKSLGIDAAAMADEYPSSGRGTGIFIKFDGGITRAGFTGLGERGKPAEKVAREAFDEFKEWWVSGACVDKRLTDQLILPMSLANGESSFTTSEITGHLITNIHTVREFLPVEFEISGAVGAPGAVRVSGVGMSDHPIS